MQNEMSDKISITREGDIVLVRKAVRDAAQSTGFGSTDITRIVTAASELARNIFKYAKTGTVTFRYGRIGAKEGIEIRFIDAGPGIEDIDLALQPGYSSGDGLGMGLPGAKRLMDVLEIASQPGRGCEVKITKWRN